ncbi:endoplasmic reticulum transmembrane protein 3 [Trichomonascus vanleenenianus]|uniref:endoplasmic reticulum transmembrane protein 3 n=1 Tax=Trichomonascus vanleenenianus TaxID=2268995 RepID=UPI003ECA028D
MTLYYTLVFIILVTEMALFLMLVAPLPRPLRKKVLHVISTSRLVAKLKMTLRFTFIFILILFIDSVNRVYRVQLEVAAAQESRNVGQMMTTDRSEIQARRFYSQRNMYLCGFTLFLSLILNRTYAMVLDLMKAEDTIHRLKGGSDETVKADALSSESKNEIARLKKQLEQKDNDIEILKKQAAALSKEYMNISDEVNAKNAPGDKKND